MIKRRHWEILYKAVLLVMVFLLASEPILVAAQPKRVDPKQEAIDSLTSSGDNYLSNVADAISLSAGLAISVSAIQSTPLTQVNENAIAQARANALKAAEASAIALGSIDDVANGIESFGSNLPEDFDAFQRAAEGLPQQMRDDLMQEEGLTSTDVDAISGGMDDLLLARQDMATNGMPVDMVTLLSQAGFSQVEIDQLAIVAGTRGLANTSLTTSLAQFRASQDEWADVRTHLLILNVQLMGYQIGTRQINGIGPRAVTEAELQEIAEDELRLLVHVAHLQELWGTDPNLEIGEGDWWFIEHYAGRAAERLDALILDSQNRGLVQDLFVLQEMKLLALSAKNGDANYVKAELDGLGKLLSFLVGDETFISQQRDGLNGLTYVAARLASHPNLRETVQWPVDQEAKASALMNAKVRMREVGMQNLVPMLGVIAEQNEFNNIKTLLFIAAPPYLDQKLTEVLNTINTIALDINQQSLSDLIQAILTGDTSNPLLFATSLFIGMIPVVNVIADIVSLAKEDETFVKALLIFGLICDLGESLALLPGLVFLAGAYIGRATTGVVGFLFRGTSDTLFKGILNGLKLSDAFKAVVDLMQVPSKSVPASDLNSVVNFLRDFFSGETQFWKNYIAYVNRVGPTGLLAHGFDEGAVLTGRILNLGVDLSDEAVSSLRRVGKDLIGAGVDLSDDAAEGLGKLAKTMNGSEFPRFINTLGNTCSVGNLRRATKTAMPVRAPAGVCNPVLFESLFKNYKQFPPEALIGAEKLAQKLPGNKFAELLLEFGDNPKQIFEILGQTDVSAKAVIIAMNQGPEAVHALSYWKDLLNNPYIAEKLAERSGRDAVALRKLDELLNLGPLDLDNLANDPAAMSLIKEIAAKSTHGKGSVFVLGKFNDFDGGYVLYGRYLESTGAGSRYFNTHPDIYTRILNRFLGDPIAKDKLLWAINEQALKVPIGNKVPFEYSFFDIPNNATAAEKNAIEAIWAGKGWGEILNLLQITDGKIPGRMNELKQLQNAGYKLSPFSSASYSYKLTPP